MAEAPDVVYLVRNGDTNPELRYSIRSLVNLPHGRVWLVGYRPSWLSGVDHIPTVQESSKYANSTRNLLTACLDDRLTSEIVLMNDDFFVMTPFGRVPTYHRGLVADVAMRYRGSYGAGMRATAALLAELGFDEPLSYELHVPMMVNRARMVEALRIGIDAQIPVLHKRTLYGNLAGVAGRQVEDVKIYNADQAGYTWWPFVSTCDSSFARLPVGHYIRESFPNPSPYEAA